ncbi:LEA type 2 family protein [Crenobacter sp. SG2303]|uniref:LEA type 2 family protein n=1 Tax=Crenobacter oryzisoli TaxID=3056844 RepID=A0ABT7XL74_9NEIS|nr:MULTISPECIES: LEA type 2 family protein [unclassified Crenobacter]MDN0074518.1 LEA type 2 family protein [Crenobacter sp. SG2303]MDN0085582.1 LEA type 2 family protein [Crenobacter sp. SG2305]
MKRLLALAALLLVTGCASLSLQKPQVSVIDIEPQQATLLEQSFKLTLRLQNPNDRPLSADGIAFQIRLADSDFGNGVSNGPISVPAYGDTTVDVTLHTTLAAWLRQAGRFLDGQHQSMPYEISGHLNGLNGWGTVPFKTQGELKLPKVLSAPQ